MDAEKYWKQMTEQTREKANEYLMANLHPEIFIIDHVSLLRKHIKYLKYKGPYITLHEFFRTLKRLLTLLAEIQIIDNCLGDPITTNTIRTAIALDKLVVKSLSKKADMPMINEVEVNKFFDRIENKLIDKAVLQKDKKGLIGSNCRKQQLLLLVEYIGELEEIKELISETTLFKVLDRININVIIMQMIEDHPDNIILDRYLKTAIDIDKEIIIQTISLDTCEKSLPEDLYKLVSN